MFKTGSEIKIDLFVFYTDTDRQKFNNLFNFCVHIPSELVLHQWSLAFCRKNCSPFAV